MSKLNPKFEFKFEPENNHQRIAVLIDADNAQAKLVKPILAEIGKFGIATVKRIYGDFTKPNLNSWKTVLLEHSILPMQQYAYTTGKNATDSALIIDAMDLLHTGRFDAFCLVSSDSDFTRLAARIRESGLTVFGIGRATTPTPFKAACDKFIETDYLAADASIDAELPKETKVIEKAIIKKEPIIVKEEIAPAVIGTANLNLDVVTLLKSAIDEISDDQGYTRISDIGSYLTRQQPDFDSRKYGHKKLSDLIKAHANKFLIDEREIRIGSPKVLYVKNKGN
ncbi:NYN domain-containing protein [Chitinibacter bivalviorum]|uniref:NYN domain-containing protein n=1 Tax=Chitinibacter bivalviorum TaxID=2739434 RepID=A0A7H9BIQ9_9NEIS|nr:NYN domain-containing protein [Chitinibacter bivalviorum]QLG87444.1 NYN domain-containing protein [Chitinibacter bivalviorum]